MKKGLLLILKSFLQPAGYAMDDSSGALLHERAFGAAPHIFADLKTRTGLRLGSRSTGEAKTPHSERLTRSKSLTYTEHDYIAGANHESARRSFGHDF
jgi:hypothetical protein